MKKKITRPDGTVVEYEGTAEELAELEESLEGTQKNESVGKGKRLLTEQDVMRMVEKALDKHRVQECHHVRNPYQVIPQPWYPTTQKIWLDTAEPYQRRERLGNIRIPSNKVALEIALGD